MGCCGAAMMGKGNARWWWGSTSWAVRGTGMCGSSSSSCTSGEFLGGASRAHSSSSSSSAAAAADGGQIDEANEEFNAIFGATSSLDGETDGRQTTPTTADEPRSAEDDAVGKTKKHPTTNGQTAEGIGTLTHVDASGRAAMVDVGHKRPTVRIATASARVLLGEEAFRLVAANRVAKGDVLTVGKPEV